MTPCPGLNIGLLTIWRINNFLTASHLSEKYESIGLFQFVVIVMEGTYPPPTPTPCLITQGVVGVGHPAHSVCLSIPARPVP